jgi:hypothetical protein
MANNLILDPALKARLQKAATQIGAKSLEDLAVALLDGGYLGKTKSPLEIMRLPREEIGRSLLSQVKEGGDEPEFFRKLIPAQQHAVILHLMHEGSSAQSVASRFWLPVEEVIRVYNRYAQMIGEDVLQIRFESFVGMLTLRVEDLYHRALQEEKGGPKIAADILFKYINTMQQLGVLYRAPVKVEHSLTEEAQEEVEKEANRIVELQKKLKSRMENGNAGTTETAPA